MYRRRKQQQQELAAAQQAIFLRSFHSLNSNLRLLPTRNPSHIAQRTFVSLIFRHALKLRYWFAVGALGTGAAVGNWYDQWHQSLPKFSLPEWAKFDEARYNNFVRRYDALKQRWENRDYLLLDEWRRRFERSAADQGSPSEWRDRRPADVAWLDVEWPNRNYMYAVGGLNVASSSSVVSASDGLSAANGSRGADGGKGSGGVSNTLMSIFSAPFAGPKEERTSKLSEMSETERIQKLQDEMLKIQLQYQRELESLEKENKVLKQRLLLKDTGEQKRLKKLKRSLIDVYSDMLDLLTEYDSSYSTADNLPRVVVVGDQSAGKTSVLEMIAQARIFPRGSGEMMTRAPVKVTLSEGPYHVAQFRDGNREYDLTKEADLAALRNEIELRMRNSVKNGRTISHDVIALTVKGPSLPRMVLVDLPGVISTVTAGMATDTKDDIVKICKQYMENPNAIILCIQDGSVDAERSNVTDLVTSVDPSGQRTILVLTKVDLAEKNLSNPDRIRKILEGKLFPMKALGYFGVVTGKGTSASSIEEIRKYEEEFFENSKLLKDGVLKSSQMTTRNMSLAVSDCFWRMVRDSIEAQADAFRAMRFNLETEWKNTFPKSRELTRDELFDKARGEILDEVVNLSLVGADEWEILLRKNLWKSISSYILDNILMPSAAVDNAVSFNTLLDIKLKHWAEKELPIRSVQVGWETLSQVFRRQVEGGDGAAGNAANSAQTDTIFAPLKNAVVDSVLAEHRWDEKALDYLSVIQLNAIADRLVPDRRSWEKSCRFMGDVSAAMLVDVRANLSRAAGPSFTGRWLYWQNTTPAERTNGAIQSELRGILGDNPDHKPTLLEDDLTVVRRNLESRQVADVNNELIRKQWRMIYREHFLQRMEQSSRDCQSFYQNYRQNMQGDNDLDCHAVVLFYRINKMLGLSCNALRQQITNTEQRRLEKEVKDILDDYSQNAEKKRTLITGKQVELAEELSTVRYIQEKLEEFIVQLHQEKS